MINKLTIDRFEGDLAVCETESEEHIIIHRRELPKEAREGSIIALKDGSYKLDNDATSAKRAAMAAKMRALFDKN